MKRPGKSDPSRPREDGYDYKREFYRSSSVAEDYDFHRFSTPERQKRNRRKWAAITKALREATGVRTILDLPCGTGRFTGALAREGVRDYDVDHYERLLRTQFAARLARAFEPEHFAAVFADPDQLTLFAVPLDTVHAILTRV